MVTDLTASLTTICRVWGPHNGQSLLQSIGQQPVQRQPGLASSAPARASSLHALGHRRLAGQPRSATQECGVPRHPGHVASELRRGHAAGLRGLGLAFSSESIFLSHVLWSVTFQAH